MFPLAVLSLPLLLKIPLLRLATNLNNLTTDVTTTIGPAAIGLVVAVAMVVVGRGFIRKFFKA